MSLLYYFLFPLPCHEPYCLHLPDTRLTFFGTFFAFCPADPVGYLSHVLRLHRESERNSWIYCTTCISVPVSTSIYTSFSLYTDFVYKRKACKLPARALSLSYPSLSIYLSTLPSPASSGELYQPTTRHTLLAIHPLLIHSLTHSLIHSITHPLTGYKKTPNTTPPHLNKNKKPWASPPQP